MVSRRPVSCSGRHFGIIVFISVVMDGRVKSDSSPCSRPWGGRVYCDVGDHRRSIIVGVGVVGGGGEEGTSQGQLRSFFSVEKVPSRPFGRLPSSSWTAEWAGDVPVCLFCYARHSFFFLSFRQKP